MLGKLPVCRTETLLISVSEKNDFWLDKTDSKFYKKSTWLIITYNHFL